MKTNRLLLLLFSLVSFTICNAKVYKVLYLGNSLTYVNDVPSLVNQIAISKGDTIVWDQNTPGGYQLSQHRNDINSLSKISSNNWDIVVIQAQSQQTAFPDGQLEVDVYPACKFLADSIRRKNPCTRIMYYMPAGWQYGDNSNCTSFPPICSYEGQFERIRNTHINMADSTDAMIIPSGVCYRRSRLSDSTIRLWSTDNVHPSLHGSYLTALSMYACFSGNTVAGSTFMPAGISTSQGYFLQVIADSVVFDSLAVWRWSESALTPTKFLSVNSHLRDLGFIEGHMTYAYLVNTSSAAFQDAWYYYKRFDSDSWKPAVLRNDTLYLQDTVCMDLGKLMQVVHSCGIYDTLTVEAAVPCFLRVHDYSSKNNVLLYPNPINSVAIIHSPILGSDSWNIRISNDEGVLCKQLSRLSINNEIQISCEELSPGYYTVICSNNKGKTIAQRFIKQE